jgi:hypothetical protein
LFVGIMLGWNPNAFEWLGALNWISCACVSCTFDATVRTAEYSA